MWNSKIEKQKPKGCRIAVKSPQCSEAQRGLATDSRKKCTIMLLVESPKSTFNKTCETLFIKAKPLNLHH